jgi:hypothetical protein
MRRELLRVHDDGTESKAGAGAMERTSLAFLPFHPSRFTSLTTESRCWMDHTGKAGSSAKRKDPCRFMGVTLLPSL